VLHLALYEGLSSREISERLGGALRPTSVDSLIFRLRRRLSRFGLPLPRR
jgi:DNA-directed RNA polymerase specialized sigma24 family protein